MNDGVSIEVEVETNMCECIQQWINTEVCNSCGKMRYRVGSEVYPEHYGPYGENCMNTGQFDAGECWLCYGKRKKVECDEALTQLDALELKYDALWEQGVGLEEQLNQTTIKAGEMQLIAGRYQYQFEHAMRCINRIDDLFEYRFKSMGGEAIQKQLQAWLKEFTDMVNTPKEVFLKEKG